MKLWVVVCEDDVDGYMRTELVRAETPWQAKRLTATDVPGFTATAFELKSTGDPGVLNLEDYYDKCQAKRKRKEANAPRT